jgi:hypothetical protein
MTFCTVGFTCYGLVGDRLRNAFNIFSSIEPYILKFKKIWKNIMSKSIFLDLTKQSNPNQPSDQRTMYVLYITH